MFINKTAATRIIGHTVTKLWTMPNGAIGVVYRLEGGRLGSTLISAQLFKTDGLEQRQTASESVSITQYGSAFVAQSIDSEKRYVVRLNPVSCACSDFQTQSDNGNGFTPPVCKHYFAVLSHLDSKNLSQALSKIA